MAGNKRERLVVVGNGMAANAFVEEVLKAGPERYSITVFGKESHPGYNRVLLPGCHRKGTGPASSRTALSGTGKTGSRCARPKR
ncbi:MAG: hypothetical protein HS130_10350 [Deltaproteobacteria bacterium]|nr:hypothetical protein [Deltaproteobacteria bacterium]